MCIALHTRTLREWPTHSLKRVRSDRFSQFGPLDGVGPSFTVEARDLPDGGTEQTLVLDTMKLAVVERRPPPRSCAQPEVIVTVSKRLRVFPHHALHAAEADTLRTSEVVFATRRVKGRPTSVEQLADTFEQSRTNAAHGDLAAVAGLLDGAARQYACTALDLVDAVRQVAPRELSDALAALRLSC